MRVLHVVESLERGGLERVVVNLALAQRAAGDQPTVCCLFSKGTLADELERAGVRVTCADKRRGFDLLAVRVLRGEARSQCADVVHAHNAMANYYAALALLGTDVRLVNTRHGMGIAANALTERAFRVSLLRTAAVAAVSEQARERFVTSGIVPARLAHTVANGIRVQDFAPATPATRTASRARLGLAPKDYVVGTVGRLNLAKDHALLIDGFARFRSTWPESRLVIVGEGPTRPDLEAQIARHALGDAVRLTGDRGDVPDLLPAFDVFALTSATEGYSLALLEAGAAALPAIATDVGGNRAIVADGVTGVVVARSVDAVARALAELARSPERRAQMAARAREWVEQHGSVGAMARAYRALYAAQGSVGVAWSVGT
jgi:glycosyltransferase involved in cell wall biosynthesis